MVYCKCTMKFKKFQKLISCAIAVSFLAQDAAIASHLKSQTLAVSSQVNPIGMEVGAKIFSDVDLKKIETIDALAGMIKDFNSNPNNPSLKDRIKSEKTKFVGPFRISNLIEREMFSLIMLTMTFMEKSKISVSYELGEAVDSFSIGNVGVRGGYLPLFKLNGGEYFAPYAGSNDEQYEIRLVRHENRVFILAVGNQSGNWCVSDPHECFFGDRKITVEIQKGTGGSDGFQEQIQSGMFASARENMRSEHLVYEILSTYIKNPNARSSRLRTLLADFKKYTGKATITRHASFTIEGLGASAPMLNCNLIAPPSAGENPRYELSFYLDENEGLLVIIDTPSIGWRSVYSLKRYIEEYEKPVTAVSEESAGRKIKRKNIAAERIFAGRAIAIEEILAKTKMKKEIKDSGLTESRMLIVQNMATDVIERYNGGEDCGAESQLSLDIRELKGYLGMTEQMTDNLGREIVSMVIVICAVARKNSFSVSERLVNAVNGFKINDVVVIDGLYMVFMPLSGKLHIPVPLGAEKKANLRFLFKGGELFIASLNDSGNNWIISDPYEYMAEAETLSGVKTAVTVKYSEDAVEKELSDYTKSDEAAEDMKDWKSRRILKDIIRLSLKSDDASIKELQGLLRDFEFILGDVGADGTVAQTLDGKDERFMPSFSFGGIDYDSDFKRYRLTLAYDNEIGLVFCYEVVGRNRCFVFTLEEYTKAWRDKAREGEELGVRKEICLGRIYKGESKSVNEIVRLEKEKRKRERGEYPIEILQIAQRELVNILDLLMVNKDADATGKIEYLWYLLSVDKRVFGSASAEAVNLMIVVWALSRNMGMALSPELAERTNGFRAGGYHAAQGYVFFNPFPNKRLHISVPKGMNERQGVVLRFIYKDGDMYIASFSEEGGQGVISDLNGFRESNDFSSTDTMTTIHAGMLQENCGAIEVFSNYASGKQFIEDVEMWKSKMIFRKIVCLYIQNNGVVDEALEKLLKDFKFVTGETNVAGHVDITLDELDANETYSPRLMFYGVANDEILRKSGETKPKYRITLRIDPSHGLVFHFEVEGFERCVEFSAKRYLEEYRQKYSPEIGKRKVTSLEKIKLEKPEAKHDVGAKANAKVREKKKLKVPKKAKAQARIKTAAKDDAEAKEKARAKAKVSVKRIERFERERLLKRAMLLSSRSSRDVADSANRKAEVESRESVRDLEFCKNHIEYLLDNNDRYLDELTKYIEIPGMEEYVAKIREERKNIEMDLEHIVLRIKNIGRRLKREEKAKSKASVNLDGLSQKLKKAREEGAGRQNVEEIRNAVIEFEKLLCVVEELGRLEELYDLVKMSENFVFDWRKTLFAVKDPKAEDVGVADEYLADIDRISKKLKERIGVLKAKDLSEKSAEQAARCIDVDFVAYHGDIDGLQSIYEHYRHILREISRCRQIVKATCEYLRRSESVYLAEVESYLLVIEQNSVYVSEKMSAISNEIERLLFNERWNIELKDKLQKMAQGINDNMGSESATDRLKKIREAVHFISRHMKDIERIVCNSYEIMTEDNRGKIGDALQDFRRKKESLEERIRNITDAVMGRFKVGDTWIVAQGDDGGKEMKVVAIGVDHDWVRFSADGHDFKAYALRHQEILEAAVKVKKHAKPQVEAQSTQLQSIAPREGLAGIKAVRDEVLAIADSVKGIEDSRKIISAYRKIKEARERRRKVPGWSNDEEFGREANRIAGLFISEIEEKYRLLQIRSMSLFHMAIFEVERFWDLDLDNNGSSRWIVVHVYVDRVSFRSLDGRRIILGPGELYEKIFVKAIGIEETVTNKRINVIRSVKEILDKSIAIADDMAGIMDLAVLEEDINNVNQIAVQISELRERINNLQQEVGKGMCEYLNFLLNNVERYLSAVSDSVNCRRREIVIEVLNAFKKGECWKIDLDGDTEKIWQVTSIANNAVKFKCGRVWITVSAKELQKKLSTEVKVENKSDTDEEFGDREVELRTEMNEIIGEVRAQIEVLGESNRLIEIDRVITLIESSVGRLRQIIVNKTGRLEEGDKIKIESAVSEFESQKVQFEDRKKTIVDGIVGKFIAGETWMVERGKSGQKRWEVAEKSQDNEWIRFRRDGRDYIVYAARHQAILEAAVKVDVEREALERKSAELREEIERIIGVVRTQIIALGESDRLVDIDRVIRLIRNSLARLNQIAVMENSGLNDGDTTSMHEAIKEFNEAEIRIKEREEKINNRIINRFTEDQIWMIALDAKGVQKWRVIKCGFNNITFRKNGTMIKASTIVFQEALETAKIVDQEKDLVVRNPSYFGAVSDRRNFGVSARGGDGPLLETEKAAIQVDYEYSDTPVEVGDFAISSLHDDHGPGVVIAVNNGLVTVIFPRKLDKRVTIAITALKKLAKRPNTITDDDIVRIEKIKARGTNGSGTNGRSWGGNGYGNGRTAHVVGQYEHFTEFDCMSIYRAAVKNSESNRKLAVGQGLTAREIRDLEEQGIIIANTSAENDPSEIYFVNAKGAKASAVAVKVQGVLKVVVSLQYLLKAKEKGVFEGVVADITKHETVEFRKREIRNLSDRTHAHRYGVAEESGCRIRLDLLLADERGDVDYLLSLKSSREVADTLQQYVLPYDRARNKEGGLSEDAADKLKRIAVFVDDLRIHICVKNLFSENEDNRIKGKCLLRALLKDNDLLEKVVAVLVARIAANSEALNERLLNILSEGDFIGVLEKVISRQEESLKTAGGNVNEKRAVLVFFAGILSGDNLEHAKRVLRFLFLMNKAELVFIGKDILLPCVGDLLRHSDGDIIDMSGLLYAQLGGDLNRLRGTGKGFQNSGPLKDMGEDLTPEQIAEAEAKEDGWRERVAKNGIELKRYELPRVGKVPYYSLCAKVLVISDDDEKLRLPEGINAWHFREDKTRHIDKQNPLIIVVRSSYAVPLMQDELLYHDDKEDSWFIEFVNGDPKILNSGERIGKIKRIAHILASVEGVQRFSDNFTKLTPYHKYQIESVLSEKQLQKIVDEKESDRKLHHDAVYDHLTGKYGFGICDNIKKYEELLRKKARERLAELRGTADEKPPVLGTDLGQKAQESNIISDDSALAVIGRGIGVNFYVPRSAMRQGMWMRELYLTEEERKIIDKKIIPCNSKERQSKIIILFENNTPILLISHGVSWDNIKIDIERRVRYDAVGINEDPDSAWEEYLSNLRTMYGSENAVTTYGYYLVSVAGNKGIPPRAHSYFQEKYMDSAVCFTEGLIEETNVEEVGATLVNFKGVFSPSKLVTHTFCKGIKPMPGSDVLVICAGCGTSAVVAAKKGAGTVTAMALDELSAESIRCNAEKLGLSDKINVFCRDSFDIPTSYDHIYFSIPTDHNFGNSGTNYKRLTGRGKVMLKNLLGYAGEHLKEGGTLEIAYVEDPEFYCEVYKSGWEPIMIERPLSKTEDGSEDRSDIVRLVLMRRKNYTVGEKEIEKTIEVLGKLSNLYKPIKCGDFTDKDLLCLITYSYYVMQEYKGRRDFNGKLVYKCAEELNVTAEGVLSEQMTHTSHVIDISEGDWYNEAYYNELVRLGRIKKDTPSPAMSPFIWDTVLKPFSLSMAKAFIGNKYGFYLSIGAVIVEELIFRKLVNLFCVEPFSFILISSAIFIAAHVRVYDEFGNSEWIWKQNIKHVVGILIVAVLGSVFYQYVGLWASAIVHLTYMIVWFTNIASDMQVRGILESGMPQDVDYKGLKYKRNDLPGIEGKMRELKFGENEIKRFSVLFVDVVALYVELGREKELAKTLRIFQKYLVNLKIQQKKGMSFRSYEMKKAIISALLSGLPEDKLQQLILELKSSIQGLNPHSIYNFVHSLVGWLCPEQLGQAEFKFHEDALLQIYMFSRRQTVVWDDINGTESLKQLLKIFLETMPLVMLMINISGCNPYVIEKETGTGDTGESGIVDSSDTGDTQETAETGDTDTGGISAFNKFASEETLENLVGWIIGHIGITATVEGRSENLDLIESYDDESTTPKQSWIYDDGLSIGALVKAYQHYLELGETDKASRCLSAAMTIADQLETLKDLTGARFLKNGYSSSYNGEMAKSHGGPVATVGLAFIDLGKIASGYWSMVEEIKTWLSGLKVPDSVSDPIVSGVYYYGIDEGDDLINDIVVTENNVRIGDFHYEYWATTGDSSAIEVSLGIAKWMVTKMWDPVGYKFYAGAEMGDDGKFAVTEKEALGMVDVQNLSIAFLKKLNNAGYVEVDGISIKAEDYAGALDWEESHMNTVRTTVLWNTGSGDVTKTIDVTGVPIVTEYSDAGYSYLYGSNVWAEASIGYAVARFKLGDEDKAEEAIVNMKDMYNSDGGVMSIAGTYGNEDGVSDNYWPANYSYPAAAPTAYLAAYIATKDGPILYSPMPPARSHSNREAQIALSV